MTFSDLVDSNDYQSLTTDMWNLVNKMKNTLQVNSTFDSALQQNNMALTPSAFLMILCPIYEAAFAQKSRKLGTKQYDATLDVDLITVEETIKGLIEEMKLSPAPADIIPEENRGVDSLGNEWPQRSSLTAAKAIHERWCRIAPICK